MKPGVDIISFRILGFSQVSVTQRMSNCSVNIKLLILLLYFGYYSNSQGQVGFEIRLCLMNIQEATCKV